MIRTRHLVAFIQKHGSLNASKKHLKKTGAKNGL